MEPRWTLLWVALVACASCVTAPPATEDEPTPQPPGATLEPATPVPCLGALTTPSGVFRRVCAGTFVMGCTWAQREAHQCLHSEVPPSEVTLSRDIWVAVDKTLDADVSFDDAVASANAASTAEGLAPCYDTTRGDVAVTSATGSVYDCEGYRLPTEAEWEYAARAGSDLLFAGTDNPAAAADLPNAWGLRGMSFGRPEWVGAEGAYEVTARIDPEGQIRGAKRGGVIPAAPGGESEPSRVSARNLWGGGTAAVRLVRTVSGHVMTPPPPTPAPPCSGSTSLGACPSTPLGGPELAGCAALEWALTIAFEPWGPDLVDSLGSDLEGLAATGALVRDARTFVGPTCDVYASWVVHDSRLSWEPLDGEGVVRWGDKGAGCGFAYHGDTTSTALRADGFAVTTDSGPLHLHGSVRESGHHDWWGPEHGDTHRSNIVELDATHSGALGGYATGLFPPGRTLAQGGLSQWIRGDGNSVVDTATLAIEATHTVQCTSWTVSAAASWEDGQPAWLNPIDPWGCPDEPLCGTLLLEVGPIGGPAVQTIELTFDGDKRCDGCATVHVDGVERGEYCSTLW